VPGGRRSSPISPGPTPVRVRSAASDFAPDRPPAVLAWAGLSSSGGRRRTHHPFCASGFGSHHCDFTCASASCARDRPGSPNQSAAASTTGTTRFRFRTTGPTRLLRRAGTECPASASRHDRTPLLRFSSPATLAGRARAVRGGRPPDDPASAFHLRSGPRLDLRDLPAR
jgi:hypothetical protein